MSKLNLMTSDSYWFRKLILDLKSQYITSGGDCLTFPDFLKESGIEMIPGSMIVDISDDMEAYGKLKFG